MRLPFASMEAPVTLTPCGPVAPVAPLGMPKANLKTLAVLPPLAVTVTVALEPAARVVTVAVGVPKPAAAPVGPWIPWGPCGPCMVPLSTHSVPLHI